MHLCATDVPKSIPSKGDPRQLRVPTIHATVAREDFSANQRCREYPGHPCVHELLTKAIQATGDPIAMESQGRTLTYAELDVRSKQLARRLCRQGIHADDLVAICVERSVEIVVTLLGMLKAGGAYVRLNPGCPREPIKYVLDDAGASVLLTTQESLLACRPGRPRRFAWMLIGVPFARETRGHCQSTSVPTTWRMSSTHSRRDIMYEPPVELTARELEPFLAGDALPLANSQQDKKGCLRWNVHCRH